MTYEETIDFIEAICVDINPNGSFIHGRRMDGSLSYPDPMPQIHLYPFITVPDAINGFDKSSMVMGFWMQGTAESSPDEAKTLIGQADTLVRTFITRLHESSVSVESIQMEPAYNIFPAVLTGYSLVFQLISKTTSC
jgi:hypothetical protein